MNSRAVIGVKHQVAVIGGGIAGPVAAIHLAHAGVRVVLFEKSLVAHHKVCGEFLSGEGAHGLRALGVDFKKLGAQPLRGFRLHGPRRTCSAVLPELALGVSRFALDEELLRLASAAGVEVRRGVLVRDIVEGLEGVRGGIVLDTSEGEVLTERVIVASGKTDFRAIQNREGRDSSLVGFKMHLRLKPSMARELGENCDLFVFDGGYGGLSAIEGGLHNFCFLIDRTRLRSIGSTWNELASHIAKTCLRASYYLDGAQPQFGKFVSVANVPYGFVRHSRAEPGFFCVGDQMAVIASLAGDGMSMATMTGLAAARAICDPSAPGRLLPAVNSRAYERSMYRKLKRQVDMSYAVHLLFKRPAACDWATVFVKTFPQIADAIFKRTRCIEDGLLPANSQVWPVGVASGNGHADFSGGT